MELKANEKSSLEALSATWASNPNMEFEAMTDKLDLTGWQDIIQYLRTLRFTEKKNDVKLNICLNNDLRFTVTGEQDIKAYCESNVPSDFTAMIKEAVANAPPVDVSAYGARIKVKRELPLAKDDARVTEALANWAKLPKYFRQIQRYEFTREDFPVRFDLSVIRSSRHSVQTFQAANLQGQNSTYEAEAELTATRDINGYKMICRGLGILLQGRQRSMVLVTINETKKVVDAIKGLFRTDSFPGPQPVTLDRRHLPMITNGYNVTDKADGLRCLLYVNKGPIYLVDASWRVYATGLTSPVKVVLDGEWIRQGQKNAFYAFDILSAASLPFLANEEGGRWAAMRDAVTELAKVKPTLVIRIKEFLKGDAAAATILDTPKDYVTDGLIFTPDRATLPVGGRTWDAQLKWKPPQDNTVDFMVMIQRDNGRDLIETMDHNGKIVEAKTLRLHVGRDVNGKWTPVLFEPPNTGPEASTCYVAIAEARSDPAGASPAARAFDSDDIFTESKELIQSNMIVEMAYDEKEPEGWRWIPKRVRHDKTERYREQMGRAKKTGSTMNAERVALSIWNSIHSPVTEEMIRGQEVADVIPVEGAPAPSLLVEEKIPLTAAPKSASNTARKTAPKKSAKTAANASVPTVPETVPQIPETATMAPSVPQEAPSVAPMPQPKYYVAAKVEDAKPGLEPGWSKYMAVTTKITLPDEKDGSPHESVQKAVMSQKSNFSEEDWKTENPRLYRYYLQLRANADPKFADMLRVIKAANGRIIYVHGNKPAPISQLGVAVDDAGNELGGGNLLGLAMSDLALPAPATPFSE